MPKIFVLSGPDVGMSFEVQEGARFGRASECAVPLRHASVSRHHAHIELDGGSWWIVDEGSRNGLSVRGERVLRAPVNDGDEFQLGEVLLRFRLASAPVAPHLPAADDQPPVVIRGDRGSEEQGGIVLEGDWEAQETLPPSHPMNIAGPAMARPPPEAPTMETARQRATEKLLAAGAMPKTVAGGRGVLQYSKVEASGGFATSDLGQQPWWIKALVGLLVLAVCAVVAWLAFKGTLWMRGGPEEPPAVEGG
jgi:hypothetical protein